MMTPHFALDVMTYWHNHHPGYYAALESRGRLQPEAERVAREAIESLVKLRAAGTSFAAATEAIEKLIVAQRGMS